MLKASWPSRMDNSIGLCDTSCGENRFLRCNMMNMYPLWISGCLWLMLCVSQPVKAEFEQDPDQWLVTIATEQLPQYLNYKNSRLHPLNRAVVKYRIADRSGHFNEWKYEDLIYSSRKVIGSRRRH